MSYLQQAATSDGPSYRYTPGSCLTLAPIPAGIMPMPDVSRRALIKATGVVSASILPRALSSTAVSAQEHGVPSASAPSPAAVQPTTYLFHNDEAAFIEAAVGRLIPADPQWQGGIEAGVPNYIDKQLAGAWGAGERLYRSGPWQPGTPTRATNCPLRQQSCSGPRSPRFTRNCRRQARHSLR
jgi:Gluconate 2-dehydrogenase subunit 3